MPPHPTRMGQILQSEVDLATRRLREVVESAGGVSFDLEALPANVRQHRDFHRQRPGSAFGALGALAGASLSAPIRSRTYAPARSAAGAGRAGSHRLTNYQLNCLRSSSDTASFVSVAPRNIRS